MLDVDVFVPRPPSHSWEIHSVDNFSMEICLSREWIRQNREFEIKQKQNSCIRRNKVGRHRWTSRGNVRKKKSLKKLWNRFQIQEQRRWWRWMGTTDRWKNKQENCNKIRGLRRRNWEKIHAEVNSTVCLARIMYTLNEKNFPLELSNKCQMCYYATMQRGKKWTRANEGISHFFPSFTLHSFLLVIMCTYFGHWLSRDIRYEALSSREEQHQDRTHLSNTRNLMHAEVFTIWIHLKWLIVL